MERSNLPLSSFFFAKSRASLHIYELINCRWADEVTQQLDNLQSQATSSRSGSGQNDLLGGASVNNTLSTSSTEV